MYSGWKRVLLGDIAEISTGKTNRQDASDSGKFALFDRSATIRKSNKYIYDCQAVIVPGEGKKFIPRYYWGKFDLHQRVYRITAKQEQIARTRYLYYFLLANKERWERVAVGSTVKSLRMNSFTAFPILLPPPDEQKTIVDVLSALDEKIELNRQMCETLEKTAATLFKSWFVDFDPVKAKAILAGNENFDGWNIRRAKAYLEKMDANIVALFPNEFSDSGIGKNPKEWSKKKLKEIADLRWGDISTTKKSYTLAGYPAFSASGKDGLLPYFDYDRIGVVVSAIGANSGKTWLALGKWSCIKNTIRFWSSIDSVPTIFLFHATNSKNYWPIRGSAQPFISQGDAQNAKVLIPNNGTAKAFGEIVESYHKKIWQNESENQILASIRDALLPKLISGKLRVKGAKK